MATILGVGPPVSYTARLKAERSRVNWEFFHAMSAKLCLSQSIWPPSKILHPSGAVAKYLSCNETSSCLCRLDDGGAGYSRTERD